MREKQQRRGTLNGGSSAVIRPADTATVLRSDKRHTIDYVLVGANVWMLLEQKFGATAASEIKVGCQYDPTGITVTNGSRIKVVATPSDAFYISPTGRFPYEKYVENKPQPAAAAPSVVPTVVEDNPADDGDDEYNDLVRCSSCCLRSEFFLSSMCTASSL